MARVCNSCGSQLPEGTGFCTRCGAKYQPELRSQTPEPGYASHPAAPAEKCVSTGAFFGLMLLFSLPVLGWVICIIMAFAPKNRNIRNFARAMLIWLVIALVISLLLGLAVNALINSATAYMNEAVGELGGLGELGALGELGGLMEEFGELENALGELEGMIPEDAYAG